MVRRPAVRGTKNPLMLDILEHVMTPARVHSQGFCKNSPTTPTPADLLFEKDDEQTTSVWHGGAPSPCVPSRLSTTTNCERGEIARQILSRMQAIHVSTLGSLSD